MTYLLIDNLIFSPCTHQRELVRAIALYTLPCTYSDKDLLALWWSSRIYFLTSFMCIKLSNFICPRIRDHVKLLFKWINITHTPYRFSSSYLESSTIWGFSIFRYTEYCTESTFLLKADDDVFINLKNLESLADKEDPTEPLIQV